MAASRADVDRWIAEAKNKGAKFIISVCDTFDWDDYPVYVMPGESLAEVKSEYSGQNMQRINEVIQILPDGTVKEGL